MTTTITAKIHKKDGKQRIGKGFSREELKKAGTNLKDALKMGIPTDPKRRTAHDENVETLKTFLQAKKATSKPKSKGKSKS
jgi:large subunit ribosomal protein L13e